MKEIPVLINCLDKTEWEEIPAEDLWEDGELNRHDVISKIVKRVLDVGDWKLIKEMVE